jgi:glutathione S-transferase
MLESWFNSSPQAIPQSNRDPAAQLAIDQATADLALYHYDSCMYCARVRKAMALLSLNIELRDIMTERSHFRDLALEGGRTTVPCLRIGKSADQNSQWMFESADIIDYLVKRFGSD